MKIEINSHEELLGIIENESAVLVYFYSNKCAPCVSLRPKVEQLLDAKFPLMKLVTIDSEKNQTIPASYSIFSSPTLIIFLEGKEYRRESKYVSISQLEEVIGRPYGMIFE